MSWPTVFLGDVTERIDYGLTASAIDNPNGPRFLRITDIQNDSVNWNTVPSCECSKNDIKDNELQVGDIVFARTGATTGKSYLIRELSLTAVFASYLIRVRAKPCIDTLYLSHFFKSGFYWSQINSMANGAAQPGVNSSKLKNLQIPFPPLEEQKRIAAILDKADAIRQKRQQAIALADDFLRSVFLDMFVRAADTWTVKTIDYIADKEKGGLRTGPFGSQLLHSEFVDSGIPVLGIDNAVENVFKWGKARFITDEKYKSLSRYTVHSEDVLITIMGTCGRCAVVPDDIPTAINTKHLCCISLDYKKALPEFLHSYYLFHPMSRQYLAKVTKGAIMDGLNMGLIKAMPFPMVPIKLQEKYVEIKMNVLSSLDKQHLSESNQEDLFNSLSQQFFVGKCLTA
ncbi:restriction endonuclease subunit S [Aeromonas rivipollensis]|uniref:restriction endonuclease subunit S n=1 Tax=Aeromonas rivipollensis TaxID=948519 RepID=UPI003D253BDF